MKKVAEKFIKIDRGRKNKSAGIEQPQQQPQKKERISSLVSISVYLIKPIPF